MIDEPNDKDTVGGAAVGGDVQAKLGEKLKEVYADVINEPVPDRFVELLNKLDKSNSVDPDQG